MFLKRYCKCLSHACWRGNTLYCTKCNRAIAIRYGIDGEVRIYPFRKFKKDKRQIEQRKDTKEIASESDLLGNVDYKGFEDLHNSIRSCSEQLSFISENEGRVQEDSKSVETSAIGEIYQIEDEEYIEEVDIELEEVI